MIKQAKAIGFIIVANILLLAHSFIPHQHSNCFASFENQYRIHHDDHDHSSKPYHHNETDNSEKEDHEGCVLKFDFIAKIKPDFEKQKRQFPVCFTSIFISILCCVKCF